MSDMNCSSSIITHFSIVFVIYLYCSCTLRALHLYNMFLLFTSAWISLPGHCFMMFLRTFCSSVTTEIGSYFYNPLLPCAISPN